MKKPTNFLFSLWPFKANILNLTCSEIHVYWDTWLGFETKVCFKDLKAKQSMHWTYKRGHTYLRVRGWFLNVFLKVLIWFWSFKRHIFLKRLYTIAEYLISNLFPLIIRKFYFWIQKSKNLNCFFFILLINKRHPFINKTKDKSICFPNKLAMKTD